LTPRQTAYIKHRAAGLGQAQAAIKAGYAKSSAKISACRMEKLPAIRAAIDAARKAAKGDHADDAPLEFEGAEDYLLAVVKGLVPPDPVRIAAAKALMPFTKRRQRVPLAAVRTPKAQQHADEAQAGTDLNARFKARVVEIAAARKKGA
jgi:hypothetical protein